MRRRIRKCQNEKWQMTDVPVATARGSVTSLETNQFVDSLFNNSRQLFDLLRRIIRCPKSVANLLVAQLRQNVSDPFCLLDRYIIQQMLILAFIIESHRVPLDAGNELRVHELLRLVARVSEKPSFFCKAGAQV